MILYHIYSFAHGATIRLSYIKAEQ